MLDKEFIYEWEYTLNSPPEKLWDLVSDTNQFNLDTKLPVLNVLDDADGLLNNGRRNLRMVRFGIPVLWEEEPFEWVKPYRFGVMRRYSAGPVGQMHVFAELAGTAQGGTLMTYRVAAKPANLLGLLAIPLQIGWLSARLFRKAIHRYDDFLQQETTPTQTNKLTLNDPGRIQFAPAGQVRLRQQAVAMIEQGADKLVVARLETALSTLDNFSLAQIRPYSLADEWGLDRKIVLNTFLRATRAGILDVRWQLICPTCRVPKDFAASMSEINTSVHCETCLVDYKVNFEESVELTFRPNPAIRDIPETITYCVAGPQITPHIVVQQLLAAGEKRVLQPSLAPGRYRVRVVSGKKHIQYIRVTPDGAAEGTFLTNTEKATEVSLSAQPKITVHNNGAEEQLIAIDYLTWGNKAVTAAEVIANQTFRDLFSREAMRPGEQFSVGNITILFTDLKSSTKMYQEMGDASAFGQVMTQFDLLLAAITSHDGAIVKTIGDAVMAVFDRPLKAYLAMQAAQEQLAHPANGTKSLKLKVGIHLGPAIAVNLNDTVDYFGTTINLASRLVEISNGENIILSDSAYHDPELLAYFAENSNQEIVSSQANLRGIQASTTIWQISKAG